MGKPPQVDSKPVDRVHAVDADAHSQAPQPKPSGSAGIDALANVVGAIEAEAAALASGGLDVLAPDAVMTTSVAKLATSLARVNATLKTFGAESAELDVLIQRLDAAVGRLFVLARRNRMPMRETHLEALFDEEDALRVKHAYARTRRAEAYYDDNLIPVNHDNTEAPDASTLASELKDGTGDAKPAANRDALVEEILTFAHRLQGALLSGLQAAETAITAPNEPKAPDLLDTLLDVAIDLLMANANAILGKVLALGIANVAGALKSEARLGKTLSDAVTDGFRDAGKGTAKKIAGKLDAANASTKSADAGAAGTAGSPKTAFLGAVTDRTHAAAAQVHRTFAQKRPALMRVPVDTLQALGRAFGPEVIGSITKEYGDLVVREWVNFGASAAKHGVDVRDPDKKGTPTKLDNVLDPYGVVRIKISIDHARQTRLVSADLPGVGDAVLVNIQKQQETLGTVALGRHIDLVSTDVTEALSGGFDLDAHGLVLGEPSQLSPVARLKIANLARPIVGGVLSDGDVFAGMYAIARWLRGFGCDHIKASA